MFLVQLVLLALTPQPEFAFPVLLEDSRVLPPNLAHVRFDIHVWMQLAHETRFLVSRFLGCRPAFAFD